MTTGRPRGLSKFWLPAILMVSIADSMSVNVGHHVAGNADSVLFQTNCDESEIDLTHTWHREGEGTVHCAEGRLALQDTGVGVVLWIRKDFPPDVRVQFDLSFSNNRGIGVFFVAARGIEGEDIVTGQPTRNGDYNQYTNGIMNCYGLSLHRFFPDGRHNPGSNIRKNSGFHQVSRAERDPITKSNQTYHVQIEKRDAHLRLLVDGDLIHDWKDDRGPGPPLEGGKIGFRLRGDRSCIMRLDNIVIESLP